MQLTKFKRCTQCGMEKLITEFNKDSNNKDGYRNTCKDCLREYDRNRYRQACGKYIYIIYMDGIPHYVGSCVGNLDHRMANHRNNKSKGHYIYV